MVDDKHILIVGIPGVLGGVEGPGDYDLWVNNEEFMMKIIEVLIPADIDPGVFKDPVAAPGAVLAALHNTFNVNSG